MKFYCAIILLFIFALRTNAQDSIWTLEQTIQYALKNNISIQQNKINERVAHLQWQQSKWS